MLVLAAGVEPGGMFSKAEPLGLVLKPTGEKLSHCDGAVFLEGEVWGSASSWMHQNTLWAQGRG